MSERTLSADTAALASATLGGTDVFRLTQSGVAKKVALSAIETHVSSNLTANTVVAAKLAMTAQYRLVGRSSASAGAGEEVASSANGFSLLGAADYAAMRALLDLEAGTDFYSKTAADAAFQPINTTTTFTPSMTFATPGDLSLASVSATGQYTRTGNRVLFSLNYTATPTFTTASGNFRLTGLPFAAADGLDGGAVSLVSGNFVWPAARTQLAWNSVAAQTYLELVGLGSAVNGTNLASTNLTSGVASQVHISGNYRV